LAESKSFYVYRAIMPDIVMMITGQNGLSYMARLT